jgi:hypothetical protein
MKLFRLMGDGIMMTWRGAVMSACALVSIFVLASAYESVFDKPVAFVDTIQAVNMSAFKQSFDLARAVKDTGGEYGTFGQPVVLKLPSSSVRLNIVPGIVNSNAFLAQTSTLQLLVTTPPRAGNIGMALLYCRSSFRTISDQNVPSAGQNIFMDTKSGWRYIYKITTVGLYPQTRPFVLADSSGSSIVVDANDARAGTNLIITGELLSVQGTSQ